jgi:aspartate-semialdehyde dehydrogenase
MAERPLRIAIVGAGTLLGKALNDELAGSIFASADLLLVDDDEALGKLAATAEEVTFIQRIEPDTFDGCDFTFFAGTPDLTRKHWRRALKARSSVIDLSGELESAPDVLIRAPWIQEEASAPDGSASTAAPDLHTRLVVSAHPLAVLLAMVATRAHRAMPLASMAATVLQPASEYGHAALEELHQQTANLLSFQPLPTEVFGGQTAFTLAVSFGPESPVQLARTEERVLRDIAVIAPGAFPALTMQILQVPVFHGYAVSIALEFAKAVSASSVVRALSGPHVHVVPAAEDFPGNVQAVEEEEVQMLVRSVAPAEPSSRRYWLWLVADNLKFAARNAIACAMELNRLRPRGTVQ